MTTSVRFLHVANGTSTTGTIHAAGLPGSSSIWADPLHDGPVPGGLTDEQLLEVRAGFFADAYDTGHTKAQARDVLKSWRLAIDTADYDELVLWYEHDLFDQLNLIQVLARIHGTPIQARATLICVGSFPGRPRFKGLGELTPDELASLFETRRPVSAAEYQLAARAWDAFRAPDPREVEKLLKTDASALPFLAPALERLLEELPSTADGLSRTEHRVLELAADGAADLSSAFSRVHDDETAFYISDLSFWLVVRTMASGAQPLMTADVQSASAGRLPRGTIALTDAGRAVLNGRADRIAEYGIDRWLGGVHLVGRGPVWRWDAAHDRVVHA